MNNHRSCVRIAMDMKGLRFRDFSESLGKATVSRILYAKGNVSDGTLRKFDEILNSGGLIHLLFIIDRLFVIGMERGGLHINPDHFVFPASVPGELALEIIKEHPLFQNGSNIVNQKDGFNDNLK